MKKKPDHRSGGASSQRKEQWSWLGGECGTGSSFVVANGGEEEHWCEVTSVRA